MTFASRPPSMPPRRAIPMCSTGACATSKGAPKLDGDLTAKLAPGPRRIPTCRAVGGSRGRPRRRNSGLDPSAHQGDDAHHP